MLNHSHLSPQDDSDDEPSTAKRAHSRGDALEYIDESCEEGEETASSEMHSEVMHSPLDESTLYNSPPPPSQLCVNFFVFHLSRIMSWMAVTWIPPMRKSGKLTAQGEYTL